MDGGTWTEAWLFSFGSNGVFPESGVILDAAGNLYGSLPLGGALNGGVVYSVTP